MKKAQIEIIGLLLIVILLSILAVIFLRLTLKPPSSEIPEARQSIIAKAAIDSIIKTSINDKQLQDLIYDCSTGYNCGLLENEINVIMPKLMPQKQYYMVFSSEAQNFKEIGSKCKIGVQANNNYVINSVPIQISLKLC